MRLTLDMVGLFVDNMEKMIAFYRSTMELNCSWDGEASYAEFEGAGIRFAFYDRSKLEGLLNRKPSFPNGINGTFELSVNVGSPEKVDKTYIHFLENGALPIYEPRNEPWKMRSAMVTDPEGNLIEIASDFWE